MTILIMDIEAAFAIMARGILIDAMTDMWIDGDHMQWTKSFPLDRTVDMVIGQKCLQKLPLGSRLTRGLTNIANFLHNIYYWANDVG